MSELLRVLTTLLFLCAACGTPTPDNGSSAGDAGVNGASRDAANVTTTDDGSANGTTNGGEGVDCAAADERFIEAVRALPRTCQTDADCKLVARAQECDCELAVSASADTADYEAARADVDAAGCDNPFGCTVNECPYLRLADDGELIANCSEEGMCRVVEILTCDDYVAAAHGGLVSSGSCMDADGCTLRSDLNPCGCQEAISTEFPLFTTAYDMMEINDARCDYDCTGCDAPVEATCAPDDRGYDVCQTM